MRQLADLVGISNPYLSQIERGLRDPSEKVLDAIAQNLQLSADALQEHGGRRPDGAADEGGEPAVVAAILPGSSRHSGQPVQHGAHTSPHLGLVFGVVGGERRGKHPGKDTPARGFGGFPRHGIRPGRELLSQFEQVATIRAVSPLVAARPGRGGRNQHCGHREAPGNSTYSESERYSGVVAAGVDGPAARRAWWARMLAIVSSTGAEV